MLDVGGGVDAVLLPGHAAVRLEDFTNNANMTRIFEASLVMRRLEVCVCRGEDVYIRSDRAGETFPLPASITDCLSHVTGAVPSGRVYIANSSGLETRLTYYKKIALSGSDNCARPATHIGGLKMYRPREK